MTADLERYLRQYSSPEEPLLTELDRATHQRVIQPRMLSGQVQGRFLEILVRMFRPKRVLEIGTFTGYSALSMAAGLDDGAELHTIEIEDELEPIITEFLERSPHGNKVHLHIGSALDVIPSLGEFDLVFMDGDKRQYMDYYEMALQYTSPNAIILADNTLWDGHVVEKAYLCDRQTAAINEFNAFVAADTRVEKLILPLRDGLTMIRKR